VPRTCELSDAVNFVPTARVAIQHFCDRVDISQLDNVCIRIEAVSLPNDERRPFSSWRKKQWLPILAQKPSAEYIEVRIMFDKPALRRLDRVLGCREKLPGSHPDSDLVVLMKLWYDECFVQASNVQREMPSGLPKSRKRYLWLLSRWLERIDDRSYQRSHLNSRMTYNTLNEGWSIGVCFHHFSTLHTVPFRFIRTVADTNLPSSTSSTAFFQSVD
jgi:hypothetical protein